MSTYGTLVEISYVMKRICGKQSFSMYKVLLNFYLCNYCNKCTYCDCDNSCRTQTITRTVRLRPRATSSEPEEIDSSDNESEPTNREHDNQTTQPSPNLIKPQPANKATTINLDDYCHIIRSNKTIKRERKRELAKLLKQHHRMMREIAINYWPPPPTTPQPAEPGSTSLPNLTLYI